MPKLTNKNISVLLMGWIAGCLVATAALIWHLAIKTKKEPAVDLAILFTVMAVIAIGLTAWGLFKKKS